MEKILIFVKHHFAILWRILEGVNDIIFRVVYQGELDKKLEEVYNRNNTEEYTFRSLGRIDIPDLFYLIDNQNEKDLRYFSPHGFDIVSLQKQLNKSAFLMMGVFCKDQLVGYFFLRFFAIKNVSWGD